MTAARRDALPELQDLNAAVIRLVAKCADGGRPSELRALLVLLGALRAHPDLPRAPAVRAGLAEAHAIWVRRLGEIARDEVWQAAGERPAGGLH